jgi:hypothetical protein
LALVLLLGFVGCVLNRQGSDPGLFGSPFTHYSDLTILPDPRLVSYWPLGEGGVVPPEMGDTKITAADKKIKTINGQKITFDGDYWHLAFPDDSMTQSAAAPGTLKLGQPGIVPGDTKDPHTNPNDRTTCIDVDGGFVRVPFHLELNPSAADGFSVEAWVRPGWAQFDPGAVRVVIACFHTDGGSQGFSLYASEVNNWRAAVGTDTGPVIIDDGPDIHFDAVVGEAPDEASLAYPTHHLVLTFEAGVLKLFVNGTQSNSKQVANYQPNTSNDLFIGCGAPQLEPVFPWAGNIQCVAVCKGALKATEVSSRFNNGMGSLT